MHVRDETGETGTRKHRNQRTVHNNKRFLCQFKNYIFRHRGKEGIYPNANLEKRFNYPKP
jgi:hypothetical protein